MFYQLAVIIFASAILLFFSQEFIRAFKWIFAIRGAKLFLPLALASWAVFAFHVEFLIAVYYVQQVFQNILEFLTQLMPFQQGASSVALMLLLTLGSVIPVFILRFILLKKAYLGYEYPYLTSTFIWLIIFMFCFMAVI